MDFLDYDIEFCDFLGRMNLMFLDEVGFYGYFDYYLFVVIFFYEYAEYLDSILCFYKLV